MNRRSYTPIPLSLEERPSWWLCRPQEIIDLCRSVKKASAEIIAETPGNYPVYALFYGDFSDQPPQSNWSAASNRQSLNAYWSREGKAQTICFAAGTHGAEAESVVAAMNLIKMLETGEDFRGKSDPELLELIRQYRLIIVPCLNMDGRAISPDHLRKAEYSDFRKISQGVWADGSEIGWLGSKEYFPLPLEKVSYPGGYPNADGFNIMHDACPGNVRTAEARGFLKMIERHQVDFLLHGHSCEGGPLVLLPSLFNYPCHVKRGEELANLIHHDFYTAGLEETPLTEPLRSTDCTVNLNTMATLASGALALTLECSVSRHFTFEELIEPNFIMLKRVLKSGLEKPLCDRRQIVGK